MSVRPLIIIPGGNGRGECEKNIKLRAIICKLFVLDLENIRTFPEETR